MTLSSLSGTKRSLVGRALPACLPVVALLMAPGGAAAQTTPVAPETPQSPATAPGAPSTPAAPAYGKADTSAMPDEVQKALARLAVPAPTEAFGVSDSPRVVLRTNKGPITLELDTKAAPLHVKSFVYLVKRNFYNNTVFHRHADLTGEGGFIIQGGDPLSRRAETRQYAGVGGPGYLIPLEVSSLKHDALIIAMARSSDPNSAGSQFYITQAPVHFLDGQYTVFGKVVAGPQAALALKQNDRLESAEVVAKPRPVAASHGEVVPPPAVRVPEGQLRVPPAGIR